MNAVADLLATVALLAAALALQGSVVAAVVVLVARDSRPAARVAAARTALVAPFAGVVVATVLAASGAFAPVAGLWWRAPDPVDVARAEVERVTTASGHGARVPLVRVDEPIAVTIARTALPFVGAIWLLWTAAALAAVSRARRPGRGVAVLRDGSPLADAVGALRRTGELPTGTRVLLDTAAATCFVRDGRTIVVAGSVAASLGESQLRAVLRHELAHLRRRDGAWLRAFAVARAAFPFQPFLGALARLHRRAIEHVADDDVRRRGGGVDLARALVTIGEGAVRAELATLHGGAPSVAERVARLLARSESDPSRAGTVAVLGVASVAALLATLLPAPAVANAPRPIVAEIVVEASFTGSGAVATDP
ncbi:MAG: M56 family metallopeptidase [Planctomycetota bacterium]